MTTQTWLLTGGAGYIGAHVADEFLASGKDVVHEQEGNIVVINTCGFIDNAKAESVNTILEYADKKERGLVDKVFVTGCLSERYRPDLEKEIPNVDQFFGTTELPQLLKALGADYKHELLGERLTTTPKNYAYLKIAEGCDRPCSFCAIPLMRGKHVSQPIEKLVKEALLIDNPNSTINKYDIAEVDRTNLEIINPSVCYTNENISYTIYRLKEIKAALFLKK